MLNSRKLTFDEAMKVAMDFADENYLNHEKVEAKAELWFDAGKEFDQEDGSALRSFLSRWKNHG